MTWPNPRTAIILIAIYAHMTGAAAQTASETWRCGNSYSDQPCPGGKAVEAADPRSSADRRAADADTRRDRASAEVLERDRLRRDAVARRQSQPIVIAREPVAGPPPKPLEAKKKKGRKEPEYFTAHDPEAALKKRKKKSEP